MSLKPIILHGSLIGANPWKVAMIINELEVPYEINSFPFSEIKKEPYISLNPNGRTPAIEDPNTGIILWESGAIIEYLVETYDKEHKISFQAGTPEYYHAKQYLYFQVSGQGPYFGQSIWFREFHPEKIASAQERYKNEALRVSGVLNGILKDREYLVGGKYTYADGSFVAWYEAWGRIVGDGVDMEQEFPNLHAWLKRLRERPAIVKAIQARAEECVRLP
ncbi:glutathione S-transferase [Aspergillus heteromorphus CBS 117.55]|uniref:glutathione transferase n=1 Tax=Aspergillus heteromorphus CBS 117.55 TaxID=1448321 RepID=A0A317X145_9EURO|nr:glutathione S-transferase [Aspergillus heteromorphus CBS 117.55]PWY90668.1 glutathione S-transferase [Aspergillus heteromorphus CBS 117.55]